MVSLVQILLSNALAATLMAAVATTVSRIGRRPALTHSLWLVVMLKLVTPPLVPVSLPLANVFSRTGPAPASADFDRSERTAAPSDTLTNFDADESISRHGDDLFAGAWADPGKTELNITTASAKMQKIDRADRDMNTASELPSGWMWGPLALVVVLAGALVWWTIAAVRIIRFQRLLKDVPPAPKEWQSHTKLIAERMGLGWCPSICLVPGRVPPMLWAIGGRPRLVVPSTLWMEMGDDQRTSLLLHELAHLKRRDHWVRWLEIVVAGLYWWHPVVWWARRALREAEEQCCDAWVVSAMPNQARTYAAALLAAVEFVSGARPAPAAASATSGSGHVSCLKRRLKMIVRAKTPKGLSWAGRIAIFGMTALLLPLAPSWAQKGEVEQATKEQRESLRNRAEAASSDDGDTLDLKQQLATQQRVDDRIAEEFKKDPEVLALKKEIDDAHRYLKDTKRDLLLRPASEAMAVQQQLDKLRQEYTELWQSKYGDLLARLTPNDKKDDDDKEDKARDVAERLQEQLKDLLGKLGKELTPVTEELRKALERAVGEVHQSLEKEGLSAESLGKALEKSQEDLRKAFEGGGAVDKELREAIDRARKDMQDAFDQTKGDVQDQVDALREQSRGLTDQARKNFDRARAEAEKRIGPEGAAPTDGDDLESARKEIRDLQQQLQRATRRLEALQQRQLRRNFGERRERNPRTEGRSQETPSTPRAEPVPPAAPEKPAAPATPARPARPAARRGLPPGRTGGGAGRTGPQLESDKRLHDLEDKMDRLLKELETLKQEKSPKDSE